MWCIKEDCKNPRNGSLLIDDFNKNGTGGRWRSHVCKMCRCTQYRERYLKHREQIKDETHALYEKRMAAKKERQIQVKIERAEKAAYKYAKKWSTCRKRKCVNPRQGSLVESDYNESKTNKRTANCKLCAAAVEKRKLEAASKKKAALPSKRVKTEQTEKSGAWDQSMASKFLMSGFL